MLKTQIIVPLTANDLHTIDQIATTCETQIKLRKQTSEYTAFANTNRQGYIAEYAFAKWLDVPFEYQFYNRLSTDVMGYQIKTTKLQTGCLIKKRSNPPGTYVFTTIDESKNEVTLRGWMLSQEIEQDCYWRTDRPIPGWFVPQSKLWSMSELTETPELAAHRGF